MTPIHWRPIEAACRAWTRTREQPHPPLPGVVQYVIAAGQPVWIDGAKALLRHDIPLDWPPTKEEYPAAERGRDGVWRQGGSAHYRIEVRDQALYEHLFGAGLLSPPDPGVVDRRKAPGG